MSDSLIFMMGQFPAEFPTDRMYAKNHMWAAQTDERIRFGFAAYAVRLLQDVYFLDWIVDAGTELRERQEIGMIESKKAESSLYAPIPGRLTRFNEALLVDPSHINVDKYGQGWLFDIQGAATGLLTPAEYTEYLRSVWELTQRTIKGQLG
jgi:glycine cleavage system H protein